MAKSPQETELAAVDCIVCSEGRDENDDASLSTPNASAGAKTAEVEEEMRRMAYLALKIGGNDDAGDVAAEVDADAAEAEEQEQEEQAEEEQAEEASKPPPAPAPDPVPVPPDATHTAAPNQSQPAEAHPH